MRPERQKKIDRIKHMSEAGMGVSFAVLVAVGPIPAIWDVHIPRVVILLTLTCFFLSFVVLIVSSFWATDREKEGRKSEVKEALRELKAEEAVKSRRTIFTDAEVKIPLKGLTEMQEAAVHGLLQKLPMSESGKNIRTSSLIAFVTALERDGDLKELKDKNDMDEVVRWVEDVTGNKVDAAHFKSEYSYRVNEKMVTKMGDRIRSEFDKLG